MPPYTGDYIEHIEPGKNSLKFYSFTPRPLMRGHMYQMDDELAALLIDAHRNIGFLEGLIKYAPNKEAFAELMLLKECTYSRMIDYDSPDFKEVLTSRGTGRGNISPIIDLEVAYRAAVNMEICAPDLSRICGIALYGESEDNPMSVRDHQTFWLGAKTNLKGYNPTAPDAVLPALADISEIFAPQFSIPVFDSFDSEKLITAVSNLFWGTSYRLFTEVFSETSKYMTVHQAKGLEWDKVIVSVTPNRFDKIQITDIYSNPKLTNESPADEFTRMYYVACSRAKEDLFIHLPDISIVDKLHESLHTFAEMTGRGIEYEIIQ